MGPAAVLTDAFDVGVSLEAGRTDAAVGAGQVLAARAAAARGARAPVVVAARHARVPLGPGGAAALVRARQVAAQRACAARARARALVHVRALHTQTDIKHESPSTHTVPPSYL